MRPPGLVANPLWLDWPRGLREQSQNRAKRSGAREGLRNDLSWLDLVSGLVAIQSYLMTGSPENAEWEPHSGGNVTQFAGEDLRNLLFHCPHSAVFGAWVPESD